MNYLAHIYLSGDDDLVKIGNFMADGIRGRNYEHFPLGIQKGILLHRQIDTFTDGNLIFRKSKHRLHNEFGHFSGIITDIFYDHFLAKNWSIYSKIDLHEYTKHFYSIMQNNHELLTENTKKLLPYMIEQNWLVSYEKVEGIERILQQMDNRINRQSNMHQSVTLLNDEYELFENEFTSFFSEIIEFSSKTLNELNSNSWRE